MIEYRICWSASSNISFRGHGDWWPANEGESAEDVEKALNGVAGGIRLPDGLEMALEGSGFDWWVETREVES
jgi:hypothetical protein